MTGRAIFEQKTQSLFKDSHIKKTEFETSLYSNILLNNVSSM